MQCNKLQIRGQNLFPTHPMVSSHQFASNEAEEAELCYAVAEVGEKNGMSSDEVTHVFPVILRILKSKSIWAD